MTPFSGLWRSLTISYPRGDFEYDTKHDSTEEKALVEPRIAHWLSILKQKAPDCCMPMEDLFLSNFEHRQVICVLIDTRIPKIFYFNAFCHLRILNPQSIYPCLKTIAHPNPTIHIQFINSYPYPKSMPSCASNESFIPTQRFQTIYLLPIRSQTLTPDLISHSLTPVEHSIT